MLLLFSLLGDEQPNFTRYCVYNTPFLSVTSECDANTFTPEISAILNVSLELNKTGWMTFNAEANAALPPKEQMRALGYAEGFLFVDHIANHHANLKEYFLKKYLGDADDYPAELYAFYADNLEWTKKQAQKNKDKYWQQVAYTMAHFDGLVLGY